MRNAQGHVGLSPEVLVDTALRILNAEGIKSLTARRLASEHGVRHPTLYHHFRSKEELLGLVAARLLEDGLAETGPAEDWREWLELFAQTMRKVLLRYRDGAAIVAQSAPVARTQQLIVPAIRRPMIAAGVSITDADIFYSCISSFTVGWVINEQNPAKHQMMTSVNDLDSTFVVGLRALVRGIAEELGLPRQPAGMCKNLAAPS